jgi:hypothetical protein
MEMGGEMLIGFCAVCELGFVSPPHYIDTLTVEKLYARTHIHTQCLCVTYSSTRTLCVSE